MDNNRKAPDVKPEEDEHQKTTILDRSTEEHFSDLNADVNALDADPDDVLEFDSTLDEEPERPVSSELDDSPEFETLFDPEQQGESDGFSNMEELDMSDVDIKPLLEEQLLTETGPSFDFAVEKTIENEAMPKMKLPMEQETLNEVDTTTESERFVGKGGVVDELHEDVVNDVLVADEHVEYDLSPTIENTYAAAVGTESKVSNTISSHDNEAKKKAVSHASVKASGGSNKVVFLVAGIGLIGFIVGCAGLWVASNANGKIAALQQELMETQLKVSERELADSKQALKVALMTPPEEPIKVETPPTKVEPKSTITATSPKVITPKTPIKTVAVVNAAKTGVWVVNVSSHKLPKLAETMVEKLKQFNIISVVTKTLIKDQVWYRVQIPGFTSKEIAEVYAKSFEKKQGISGIWIGKIK